MQAGSEEKSKHPHPVRLGGARSALLSSWEGEQESAAVVECALGTDGATVGEHDVLGDSEAEAGAAGFARSRFVDAIEALEKARKMLGGDARAEILHVEFDSTAGGAGAENDATTRAPVLHGIVDEIRKHLVNGFAVGPHRGQRVDRPIPT